MQKRRAFAWRSRLAFTAEPQRVVSEALLIRLELLPADVAHMNVRNHELPLCLGNLGRAVPAVWQKPSAHATVDEGTRIAGVMQDLQDSRVCRSHPMQFPLVHSLANAAGKHKPLLAEQLGSLHRGAGPVECLEHQAHRSLYFGVGIENQDAVVAINQTDGRAHLQLAASRFVDHSASHSGLEKVQFRFRHGPF